MSIIPYLTPFKIIIQFRGKCPLQVCVWKLWMLDIETWSAERSLCVDFLIKYTINSIYLFVFILGCLKGHAYIRGIVFHKHTFLVLL